MPYDFNKGMANPLTALGLSLVANTHNPGQAIQQGLNQGLAMKKQYDKELAGKALAKAIAAGADPNEAFSAAVDAGMDPMDVANTFNALNKGRNDNLPQGYRMGNNGMAELIPGVDPSYGTKQSMMITPYQAASLGMQGQAQQNAIDARREQMEERRRVEAEKQAERGADRYATRLNDAKIPNFAGALKGVEADLQKFGVVPGGKVKPGQDIPGFGGLAGRAPDWMVSSEGKDFRQNFQSLFNNYVAMMAGLSQTQGEAERQFKAAGLPQNALDFKDDNQILKGIEIIKNGYNSSLQNIAAGVPPESLDIYKERGGTILPSTLQTPAPSGAAPITATNPQTGQKLILQNGQWVPQ